MKPKEGTILTVAKGAAQKAAELAETTEDLEIFLPEVIRHAEEVLAQTPEDAACSEGSRGSRFGRTGIA